MAREGRLRRRRGSLVAIVGIDGSGKSTQAARLAERLRSEGQRARAFENPGGRPVLDAIARRAGRADGGALLGRRGRVTVELIVRTLAIWRAVTWARVTGGTAVLDRCGICQLATMRARDDRGQAFSRAWNRRFPAPDVVVWLSIDPAVALRRVAARGRDTESLNWLKRFDAAYAELLEDDVIVIRAEASERLVAAALREAVAGPTP